MRQAPEWIPRDSLTPQGGSLISTINGCAFSFSSVKMDFSIDQPLDSQISQEDLAHFNDQVDLLPKIVIDHLGLQEFARIGFRAWYLFRCNDRKESEEWLQQLKLVQVSPKFLQAWGKELEALSATIVVGGADRHFRVFLSGVEKSATIDRGPEVIVVRPSGLSKEQDKLFKRQLQEQKNPRGMPHFAALIDIDAYQDDPIAVDPRHFVETSLAQLLPNLKNSIEKC